MSGEPLNSAQERAVIDTGHALADLARAAILPHFRARDLVSENKAGGASSGAAFDPVTEADRAAEAAMRDHLSRHRPEDGILGEEFADRAGTSGLTWVLDPVDGTRGFICGTPTWGVLIAASGASGPLFGVIDQPYIGERFVGGLGEARVIGPRGEAPLRVSGVTELAEAKILTTFPEIGSEAERAAFHALAGRCRLTRYGMDCYGYALLAAGAVDLVVEAGLQAYDIQAPIAVVEAAGGCVTRWDGTPAHEGGTALAAATPELHAQAMDILMQAHG